MANIIQAKATSLAIHQVVIQRVYPKPSLAIRVGLIVFTLWSPVAAVFYILAAIKRAQGKGTWHFRIEANGVMHVNVHLINAILATCYTIFNTASLISLQVDLKGLIQPHTVTFSLLTHPFLFLMGWIHVWCVLSIIPPSKHSWGNSQVLRKVRLMASIPPKVRYALVTTVCLIPIGLLFVEIEKTYIEMSEVLKVFHAYDADYQLIMENNMNAKDIETTNLSALKKLEELQRKEDQLIKLDRLASIGFLLALISSLSFILGGSFLIFRALNHQLNLLRQIAREKNDVEALNESDKNHKTGITNNPLMTDKHLTSFESKSHLDASIKAGPNIFQKLNVVINGWKTGLSSIQAFEQINAAFWSSVPSSRSKNEWINTKEDKIYSHYERRVKVFKSTIGLVLLSSTIHFAYIVLNVIILTNAFQVPQKHTMSDFFFLLVIWSNFCWNFGVGSAASILSFLVSGAPSPQIMYD
ncbi:hypothetical protein O181_087331 [Austropuccinia psidii MF-1]|uniref:Uncharacterized protein n=1 Tax=Austropuccinia psidii MF-1 TaxID=1389203 RepID=A0A9Q3IPG0_9BASI|nr:hypothetical protein [Austropuccinia psidii MF-1]